MKVSKYTYVTKREGCSVLYNIFSENISVIEDELADKLLANELNVIKEHRRDFYDYLLNGGFILPADTNEPQLVVDTWQKEDTSPAKFSIYVNPTLDCNLRCWYCYEKHLKGSVMSEKVLESLKKLIASKVKQHELKLLVVSFFGGEPLLKAHEIVLPLIEYAQNLCNVYGKKFMTGFVTNATLMTPDVLDAIVGVAQNPVGFQIALDGNREYHNKTKHFEDKLGSYDLILGNIKYALSKHAHIKIRLNATAKNVDTYLDVLNELTQLSEEQKKYLHVDFQRVWQDVNAPEDNFEIRQQRVRDFFKSEGFNMIEAKCINPSRCYADKDNHVVVNYNGDLFSCTARDFATEDCEGVLTEDGLLKWNDKRSLRLSVRYGNQYCRSCSIFPLCHGGCSQNKLECNETNGCMRKYTEKEKIDLIENRIDFLLESVINFNS